MELMKKARSKEFWEQVKNDRNYDFLRKELLDFYDKLCNSPIEAVKFSEYKIFYETGSRTEYQEGYYNRRRRMNVLALLSLIYPENSCYITKLEDVLWAVLDEYCWALPAHVADFENNDNTFIDLFAAETGITLTEIMFFLDDRLSPLIKSRIKTEVEKRIIDSYINRKGEFFWDTDCTNNWAAVCSGCVGSVFLYLRPDMFEKIKPRIEADMERFLSGFFADGVCREGLEYWSYGFGFYVFYNDLLRRFTGGKTDCFKNPKIKEIAFFQQKCYMQGNAAVSFADGRMTGRYSLGLTHLLKSIYPELIVPPVEYSYTMDPCGRWFTQSRSFIYFNPDYLNDRQDSENIYFMENSGWIVKKSETLAFAAKGGSNDEPHNHNDIGNFIIAKDGRQILCDLGQGNYTREYFSEDGRYNILCNSSFGHSVPSIEGEGQSPGREYSGTVSYENGIFRVDMTKAYNISELCSLVRNFSFKENSIVLKDEFRLTREMDINERFISLIQPEITDGCVKIGGIEFSYDTAQWIVSLRIKKHTDHFLNVLDVYCIDLTARADYAVFETEFKICG